MACAGAGASGASSVQWLSASDGYATAQPVPEELCSCARPPKQWGSRSISGSPHTSAMPLLWATHPWSRFWKRWGSLSTWQLVLLAGQEQARRGEMLGTGDGLAALLVWNAEESLRRASSGCQRRMAGHLWSPQSGGEGRKAKQRVEVCLTDFEQSKARVERAKRHAGLPRHEKCWQLPIQKVAAHDFSTWLAQKNIQKNKGRATKTFNSNILAAQEKHQGFFMGNAWVGLVGGPPSTSDTPKALRSAAAKGSSAEVRPTDPDYEYMQHLSYTIIYNHIWKKHIIISIYIKPVACPSKDLWNYLKWLNILNKTGYIMIDKQCMALIYPSYSRYQHGNKDPKLETSRMTIQKQDLPIFGNHRLGLTWLTGPEDSSDSSVWVGTELDMNFKTVKFPGAKMKVFPKNRLWTWWISHVLFGGCIFEP